MARIVVLLMLLLSGCHPKKEDAQTRFWTWFRDNAAALRAEEDLQVVMERISAELEKVHRGIFAEIGVDGSDRLFVISADGHVDLFPVVQRVYEARPDVPGWKIVAFRPRSRAGEGFAIEMGAQKLSAKDVKFVAETVGSKLDVVVFVPAFDNTDQMKQVAYILMDHTVGEYDMETRIGVIEFASLDAAPAHAKPLTELAAAVDALH